MVRLLKLYTIIDPELRNLFASTLLANVLLFLATLFVGFAVNCLMSAMVVPAGMPLSEEQRLLFKYGPFVGFGIGIIFFLLTVAAWAFGYSNIRNIRKTSRDGRLVPLE